MVTEHVEENLHNLVGIELDILLLVHAVLNLLEVEKVIDEAQHELGLVNDHEDEFLDFGILVESLGDLLDALSHLEDDA